MIESVYGTFWSIKLIGNIDADKWQPYFLVDVTHEYKLQTMKIFKLRKLEILSYPH